jgi:hypothetical protein
MNAAKSLLRPRRSSDFPASLNRLPGSYAGSAETSWSSSMMALTSARPTAASAHADKGARNGPR